MMTTSKPNEVKRMIEIRNEKLIRNGKPLSEDELIAIVEKAQKWDEFQANFKGGAL